MIHQLFIILVSLMMIQQPLSNIAAQRSASPDASYASQETIEEKFVINQQEKVSVLNDDQRDFLFYGEDKESFVTKDFRIEPNTIPTCYKENYRTLTNKPEGENTGFWAGTSITTQNFDHIMEQAYDAAESEVMSPSFWNAVIDGMGTTNNPFVQDVQTISVSVDSGNPTWVDEWKTTVARDNNGVSTIFGPSYYGNQRLRLYSTEPLRVVFDMTWFDGRIFRITGHLDSYTLNLEHRNDVFGTHEFKDADTSFASNVFAGSGKNLFYDLSMGSDLEAAGMELDFGGVIGIVSSENIVIDSIQRVENGQLTVATDTVLTDLITNTIESVTASAQLGALLSPSQREAIFGPIDEAFGIIETRDLLLNLPHFAAKEFLTTEYITDNRQAFVCDGYNRVKGSIHPASAKPKSQYVEQGVDYNF